VRPLYASLQPSLIIDETLLLAMYQATMDDNNALASAIINLLTLYFVWNDTAAYYRNVYTVEALYT